MKYRNDLTQAQLKAHLHYNPETGIFTRVRINKIAGFINSDGYVIIKLFSVAYKAHRLAFLYVTGEWPKEIVDHKDLDQSNNIWENIREATGTKNRFNTMERVDNKLGIKGIHLTRSGYKAQIQIHGKKIFLGYHKTKEEAKLAHDNAATFYAKEFARHSVIKNGTT